MQLRKNLIHCTIRCLIESLTSNIAFDDGGQRPTIEQIHSQIKLIKN
jgi:hypothetical protein